MRFRFVALAAMLFALLVGCGSDPTATPRFDDGGAQSTTRQAEPTTAPRVMPTPAQSAEDSGGSDANVDANVRVQLASFAQNRIIVHTARMTMVVENIADAVNRIGGVAERLNGWVVSSDRSSGSTGAIAIRVPAVALDEAFRQLEALAIDVESRAVTSQDFTDEYVDTQSRLVSLRATEQRLLSFLERSANVEEALLVEAQLSNLLQEIEAAQGRLNYLGETSAYSLIEISLKIRAAPIRVNAGPDSSVRVGELARFRASFTAPQGIDEFAFLWNFGDGTSTGGSGSAPTPAGDRVTATVTHIYGDDRDSPYIVTVDLTGSGDRGLVEGSDSLLVSVSRVPVIEVFAGENRTVEEGEDVDYTASFTRPVELRDYEYRWDFAGSPTRTGKLEEGVTRVELTRAFPDHRPDPFEAVLTVSAMSDVGRVSGSDSFSVQVTESEGFFIGGWNIEGTTKAAVRALTAVAQVATVVAIWLGVFLPVFLVVGGAVYLVNRVMNRTGLSERLRSRPSTGYGSSRPVRDSASEPEERPGPTPPPSPE